MELRLGIAEPWPAIQELIGHTLALSESRHQIVARLQSAEGLPEFLEAIGSCAVNGVVFGPNMLPHVSQAGDRILKFVQRHNEAAQAPARRIATIAVGTLAMDEQGLQALDRRVGANNVVAGLPAALDEIQKQLANEPASAV